MWPTDPDSLIVSQQQLASAAPPQVILDPANSIIAGCWVCFPRGLAGPGTDHDPAWSSAVIMSEGQVIEQQMINGKTGAGYVPGLMALRIGPLIDQTVRALARRPDVVLLDATARDHPRRAGLALQLGAELDIPTIGVTHRPLIADGEPPADARGATAPLRLDGEVVGAWLRTRAGARPVAVHAAWRTDVEAAVAVVLAATGGHRTPEPIRAARRLAREARAEAGA